MADIVDLSTLAINTTISFKTLNAYDQNTWRGTITGSGNYNLVKTLTDLLPYYQQVKKSVPNLANIEDLNYLVFDMYENAISTTTNRRVFAKEWIDPSSVKIVDVRQHIDIRIFNVTSADQQKIIDILADHSYSSSAI